MYATLTPTGFFPLFYVSNVAIVICSLMDLIKFVTQVVINFITSLGSINYVKAQCIKNMELLKFNNIIASIYCDHIISQIDNSRSIIAHAS